MATKRITELEEITRVDSNQYMLVDGPSGTKKIKAESVGAEKVNLLDPTLATTTLNGVTCTNNDDGTYTLNGTATVDHTRFYFENGTLMGERLEKGKTYKLLDGLNNTSMSTYDIHIALYNGTTYVNYAYPTTNGEVVFTLPTNVVYDRYYIYLNIRNGQTLDNVVIKPMLTTDLSATYEDFIPYTLDNTELTKQLKELRTALLELASN